MEDQRSASEYENDEWGDDMKVENQTVDARSFWSRDPGEVSRMLDEHKKAGWTGYLIFDCRLSQWCAHLWKKPS